MKDITEKLLKFKDYDGEDKIVDSWTKVEALAELPDPPVYKFGIPYLDRSDVCNGMEGGELIAISGPRKSGKTLLASTITKSLHKQSKIAMWLQYEVTAKQFFNRFEGDVPYFILPNKLKMNCLEWVYDKIIEAIAKCGVQVVFIDHLHYLFDLARSNNVSIEIGQIIRQLKLIAVELEIVIVLMCHMTKLDPYKEPSDSDMRDSSMIAAESDTSIVVWRDSKDPSVNHVKVCFSRRTGAIEQKFRATKKGGVLVEYSLFNT